MLKIITKSRFNSALTLCLLSIVALIFPLSFVLVGGLLALITLSHDTTESLFLTIISLASIYLFDVILGVQSQNFTVAILLALWLPIIFIADRINKQGELTVIFLYVVVVALIYQLLIYSISDFNPINLWRTIINNQVIPTLENHLTPAESVKIIEILQENDDVIVRNLTAIFISVALFFVIITLLIGRYWQAKLYNPTGFKKEFQNLVMGKLLASISLAVIALSFTGLQLAQDLQQTLVLLFLIQGLSVAHFWATQKKFATFVIPLFYIALFIVPLLSFLIAIVGASDNWVNFRTKLQIRQ